MQGLIIVCNGKVPQPPKELLLGDINWDFCILCQKISFTIGSRQLFLAEHLISLNELGHMPIKSDIKQLQKMVVVYIEAKWAKYHAGYSSTRLIHPSKVGMIKKQQQDDDKVSTSTSVNARLYYRAEEVGRDLSAS